MQTCAPAFAFSAARAGRSSTGAATGFSATRHEQPGRRGERGELRWSPGRTRAGRRPGGPARCDPRSRSGPRRPRRPARAARPQATRLRSRQLTRPTAAGPHRPPARPGRTAGAARTPSPVAEEGGVGHAGEGAGGTAHTAAIERSVGQVGDHDRPDGRPRATGRRAREPRWPPPKASQATARPGRRPRTRSGGRPARTSRQVQPRRGAVAHRLRAAGAPRHRHPRERHGRARHRGGRRSSGSPNRGNTSSATRWSCSSISSRVRPGKSKKMHRWRRSSSSR